MSAVKHMQAPFPYFGGKSRIAPIVWERLGNVPNYVEPFFGSGAMLLCRPTAPKIETVNDIDGFVSNFWRAVQAEPDAVAEFADWPVNENDLHARHAWLVGRKDSLQARLEGDPGFYDAKVAGWWCWGMCCWIGSGFCSGQGPWHVVDGRLIKAERGELGNAGRGINRKRVHLGDKGRGVNRQLVHLADAGLGVNWKTKQGGVYEWMRALAERLRHVRVCCGDWARVCGDTPTIKQGLTGVFLDPPYSAEAGRDNNIYRCEDLDVAHAVREWAIERGGNPKFRIALCGYDGEHNMPGGWHEHEWKTKGGYGSQGGQGSQGSLNAHRERIWFSPHCLNPVANDLALEFAR